MSPTKSSSQTPQWLRQRAIGKCQRGGAQISIGSMRRLKHEATLEGHYGCVNCLQWNCKGNLLLSGSDDGNVIVWEPFNRGTKRHIIRTGCKGNIFSVKFMPDFSDNLIASCASDGSIKLTNLFTAETVLDCKACHKDRVKRLATHPNEPHLLWSAGEDGCVMQYDTREPHNCKSTDGKPKNLLIDLKYWGLGMSAKCLDLNPLREEMLAVGSNDVHVRLFDRRHIRAGQYTSFFTPGHLMRRTKLGSNRQSFGTTYLTFSPDGSELLVNTHAEQIYLYKTYEPWERCKSFESTVKPLMQNQDIKVNNNYSTTDNNLASRKSLRSRTYAPWRELRNLHVRTNELPEQHRNFYNQVFNKVESDVKLTLGEMNKVDELLIEIKDCVELYQLRASALNMRGWPGDYYQALRDSCCAFALKPLDHRSLNNLANTVCHMEDKEFASSLLEFIAVNEQDFGWDALCRLENAIHNLETFIKCQQSRYSSTSSWLDSQFSSDDERASCSDSISLDNRADIEPTNEAVVTTATVLERYLEEENDADAIFDIQHFARRVSRDKNGSLKVIDSYDFAKRYCGHCNMNTDIKEANFFGCNGEFIVGGSDDGAFYIWEKETTNIVKAVHADLQILNCLQPHPSICMLATSGIESTVKLWSLSGKVDQDVKSLEQRCSQNQDFITSDPLEAMIMLLTPRDI